VTINRLTHRLEADTQAAARRRQLLFAFDSLEALPCGSFAARLGDSVSHASLSEAEQRRIDEREGRLQNFFGCLEAHFSTRSHSTMS
jgi:hypothetical protein